jgi:hypothetical protein
MWVDYAATSQPAVKVVLVEKTITTRSPFKGNCFCWLLHSELLVVPFVVLLIVENRLSALRLPPV